MTGVLFCLNGAVTEQVLRGNAECSGPGDRAPALRTNVSVRLSRKDVCPVIQHILSILIPALPILIPAGVVILGWIVAHELNVRRDTLAKRRDLRVQYLIEAYRKLEDNAGRINALPEVKRTFESAVADIQLLGTRTQIDALLLFLQQFKDNTNETIDPVLKLLRDDLRKELNLEVDVQSIHQFRFTEQKAAEEQGTSHRVDAER